MHIVDHIITKKYAIAYLKAYQHELSYDVIEKIPRFIVLLKKHSSFIACLSQPQLPDNKKQKIIDALTQQAGVSQSIATLMMLLIKDRRLTFFIPVLQSIILEYYTKNNIVPVTIETSHELDDKEKEDLIEFIKKMTQAENLKPHFTIKPSLISGLRIVGKNLLWEQSVDKVLKNIKHSMLQRVEL